jgi:GTP cyclohydrolase I
MNLKLIEEAFKVIANEVKPDWISDEDMQKTPERFAGAIEEWFTPKKFSFTTFEAPVANQYIEVGEIDFHSFCKHHFAAIIGKVSISYVCDRKIAGLSKFARLVDYYSKGFMIQEEFTKNIFEFLSDELQPNDLHVRVEALHTCMTTRGVNKENAVTVTELRYSE